VKYRGVGMNLQELRPSRILEGINPVNYGHNFPRRESCNKKLLASANLQSVSEPVNITIMSEFMLRAFLAL
jgi:hypothetical protein